MKVKLSETGRKILWKAVRGIEAHPGSFNMGTWLNHDSAVKGKKPFCGTVACIGGHIVLQVLEYAPDGFTDIETPQQYRKKLGEHTHVIALATEVLGCRSGTASNLFEQFFYKDKAITSKNVRQRVREWLRTGE